MAAVVVERFPLTVSTFTLLGEFLVAEWLVMRNGRTRGVLAPAKPPASTSFTARWCLTSLGPSAPRPTTVDPPGDGVSIWTGSAPGDFTGTMRRRGS